MTTKLAKDLKVGDWYKPTKGWWWPLQVITIEPQLNTKLAVTGKFPKGATVTFYYRPDEKVEMR